GVFAKRNDDVANGALDPRQVNAAAGAPVRDGSRSAHAPRSGSASARAGCAHNGWIDSDHERLLQVTACDRAQATPRTHAPPDRRGAETWDPMQNVRSVRELGDTVPKYVRPIYASRRDHRGEAEMRSVLL